jgi:hypothetical protein
MKLKRKLVSIIKFLLVISSISLCLFLIDHSSSYITQKGNILSKLKSSNLHRERRKRTYAKNDRVSPINFKRICDWHYGRELVPKEDATSLRDLDETQAKYVTNQSVIFVGSPYIGEFYTTIRPLLNVSFVLVTGDTDDSVPIATLDAEVTRKILLDRDILHWHAMNCDMPLERQDNEPKFSCLMNGISQWQGQRENMQEAYELGIGLKEGHYQDLSIPKSSWILSAFALSTNAEQRQTPYDLGCNANSSLRDITTCYYKSGIGPLDLYRDIARHKFILSPHGVGLDCYRTYETLFLGSYPIVKTSTLDYIYKNLPVLIVKRWEDINLGLLQKTYREFRDPNNQRRFNFEQLYVDYWNKTFRAHF